MKSLLLLISLLFTCQTAFSQNYIFKGRTKYRSTPNYDFQCSSCPMGGSTLSVAFAKTSIGGLMLLSTSTPFAEMRIAGTVFLYLTDGSMITCTDKGIKDRVDGESKALYYLTANEIEILTQNNTSKIRFAIHQSGYGPSSSESLTAKNPDKISFDDSSNFEYNIPEDIIALDQ